MDGKFFVLGDGPQQQSGPEDLNTLAETEASKFLAIARIVRPQGRRGEVVAETLTDFPERFAQLRQAYLERPGHAPDAVALENAWLHKGRVVLKFAGVNSIDEASQLRGLYLLVPQQEKWPLPPHHYYVWELKGCRVVAERGGVPREIGTVADVEPTGGADLLHVARQGRHHSEVLIPLAQDICKRIDLVTKTIVIDPPEHLLDLNEES